MKKTADFLKNPMLSNDQKDSILLSIKNSIRNDIEDAFFDFAHNKITKLVDHAQKIMVDFVEKKHHPDEYSIDDLFYIKNELEKFKKQLINYSVNRFSAELDVVKTRDWKF